MRAADQSRDGSVTQNAVIIVRGERIEQAGAGCSASPTAAKVIDLSAYTVLPGLIDCHTHVMLQPEDERGAPPVITKSQAFRTVQATSPPRNGIWKPVSRLCAISTAKARASPTSPFATASIEESFPARACLFRPTRSR